MKNKITAIISAFAIMAASAMAFPTHAGASERYIECHTHRLLALNIFAIVMPGPPCDDCFYCDKFLFPLYEKDAQKQEKEDKTTDNESATTKLRTGMKDTAENPVFYIRKRNHR